MSSRFHHPAHFPYKSGQVRIVVGGLEIQHYVEAVVMERKVLGVALVKRHFGISETHFIEFDGRVRQIEPHRFPDLEKLIDHAQ